MLEILKTKTMLYLIGFLISGIITTVLLKTAKEVDTEMTEDIEAATKEPSFYERMQMWKYANKVIEDCLKIETE
jgi:hypothetical protein